MVSITFKFKTSNTSQKLVRSFTNFSPNDFSNDLQQRFDSFLYDIPTINQLDIFDKFYTIIPIQLINMLHLKSSPENRSRYKKGLGSLKPPRIK